MGPSFPAEGAERVQVVYSASPDALETRRHQLAAAEGASEAYQEQCLIVRALVLQPHLAPQAQDVGAANGAGRDQLWPNMPLHQ